MHNRHADLIRDLPRFLAIDPHELFNARTRVQVVGAGIECWVARPNPFSDRTSIVFDVPVAGQAALQIYDVAGRLVLGR